MKTLQQMEQEYDQYQIKTAGVKTLQVFFSYIKHGISDTKEYQREYLEELRENERWKLSAKIRNFFYFAFAEEDVDFYDLDNAILGQCIDFTKQMNIFYRRIKQAANDDNFLELLRLVDFSADCYNAQMDYYDYKRDQLELSMQGINMYHGKHEDCSDLICEFMDKKIQEVEPKKHPEDVSVYVKKRDRK